VLVYCCHLRSLVKLMHKDTFLGDVEMNIKDCFTSKDVERDKFQDEINKMH